MEITSSSNFIELENTDLQVIDGGNWFTEFVLDSASCVGLSAGSAKLLISMGLINPWLMLGCGLFAGGIYLIECYENAKSNGFI
ncbi:MAG: hypothetical protein ACRC7N_00125 [Clostridium sp.]